MGIFPFPWITCISSKRMENEGGGLSGGLGLESALLDQRMRAEKHKTNFEALKAQHLILQDVCTIHD